MLFTSCASPPDPLNATVKNIVLIKMDLTLKRGKCFPNITHVLIFTAV